MTSDNTSEQSYQQGFSKEFVGRFWSKVTKQPGPDGCWLWGGAIFKDRGYGQVCVKPNRPSPVRAHRLSWMIHFGYIVHGMCVLHSCDNRLCVRPNHLWLGTQRENIDDMLAKGRSLMGERNHKAKISSDTVLEIRGLYHSGKFTQLELANIFGLHQPQISCIVHHKSWRHVK